jgi:hypothetical protein
MRKINYLAMGLCLTALFSCQKETPTPNTSPSVTVTPIPTPTPAPVAKDDCEINHQGVLKVVNTSSSEFYIYIEDVYVLTSKPNTTSTYNKVPASSELEIKALNTNDNSDLRSVSMPFYDCTITEIDIN